MGKEGSDEDSYRSGLRLAALVVAVFADTV